MVQEVVAKEQEGGRVGLPTVEGRVGGRVVTVLRDTGCNTVIVRRHLMLDENSTGALLPMYLIEYTVRLLPEAEVEVSTPFFTG